MLYEFTRYIIIFTMMDDYTSHFYFTCSLWT